MNKCCIIVAAGSLHPADLPFAVGPEDLLIAADAGYLSLTRAGITPDLLIGDFDSMPPPHAPCEILRLPVVKDETDTVFAVKEGFRRGYTRFVIYGGLGGDRLSHTLANLQLLSFIREQGGDGTLVCGGTRVFLLRQEERVFPAGQTGILSLFAVSETAAVTLTGLQYPLQNTLLTRKFPLGVSNHFTGKPAAVTVHSGTLLAVLEAE